MNRDGLKALLQLGFMFTGLSLCSLMFQPPNSGEFVLSVCSLGIGLTILGLTFLLILLMR
ncbi:MAG: hypothetical protein ACLFTK_10345 [Anaerolineales bacterium]